MLKSKTSKKATISKNSSTWKKPQKVIKEKNSKDQEPFEKSASFARAFLSARQRNPKGKIHVMIVRDANNTPIAFGQPVDWEDGVAARVLNQQFSVEVFEYDKELESYDDNQIEPLITSDYFVDVDGPKSIHSISFEVNSNPGFRRTMEDAYCIIPNFAETIFNNQTGKYLFFGVFDGHMGKESALYCADNLHKNIITAITMQKENEINLENSINKGYQLTEQQWCEIAEKTNNNSGCVCTSIIISSSHLFVATLGDVQAVLSRGGIAIPLTSSHVPSNYEEKHRIIHEGGFVNEDGRLNGELSVARSFGDFDLQKYGGKMKGLSSIPCIKKYYIDEEDEFIILACDGLWDVMSYQSAISYARRSLLKYNSLSKTADGLVAEALRKESTDNITVIVIGFQKKDQRIIISNAPLRTSKNEDNSKPRPRFNFKGLSDLVGNHCKD